MRCLYCGKEITEKASVEEKECSWHKKCIRHFFNVSKMPKLDLSKEQLEKLANETVNQGLTIPGVQKKLSLHFSEEEGGRLTIVDYPTGYILKPQAEEFDMLPEFENLAMSMAELAGIQVVPHGLIKMEDQYVYITKRIDRDVEKKSVRLYAMEDFCQLSERLTQDKYRGSYEGCGRIIKNFSSRPGIDLSELFLRIVFSYVIGNSDMHLKNFSLIEEQPGSRRYYLSAAYDMLPVNIVMPEDNEQLALTLNGKKKNIRKKDFFIFAGTIGLQDRATEKIIKKICTLQDKFLMQCDASYLTTEKKEQVKKLICERISIINDVRCAPKN